ncbi:hypothetical protein M422DRAFT_32970 [Sphaerobolus stellatus SS14]|uniref:Uncharacterized protein n=1 Tax=Sphaerobolus stellatus (strain SS14) TaxID=990650 RepID=A0A0C9VM21_SPHS4|nr:hypothetical protein M422DRAFT_32970 [Sphaerobolus stellatus SS14]
MSDSYQSLTFIPVEPSQFKDILGDHVLPMDEMETAYERAYGYILQKVSQLKNGHGWKDWEYSPEDMLFNIAPLSESFIFSLPLSFSSFFDDALNTQWSSIFDGCDKLLEVEMEFGEKSLTNKGSFPPPLVDIVYLLQCFAPGMLLVSPQEALGATVRGLPSLKWIDENSKILQDIFLKPEILQGLRSASIDFDFQDYMERRLTTSNTPPAEEAFYDYADRDWSVDDDNWVNKSEYESLDYEYCDIGCGYCGHCADAVVYGLDSEF